jgi:hypothetical protein
MAPLYQLLIRVGIHGVMPRPANLDGRESGRPLSSRGVCWQPWPARVYANLIRPKALESVRTPDRKCSHGVASRLGREPMIYHVHIRKGTT